MSGRRMSRRRRRPTRRLKPHKLGSFWPVVREEIWRRAHMLYAAEMVKSGIDISVSPTREELYELGYFDEAKKIVLREVHREW
jgi:hypothetical protein